jgi:deazaflavin-dependent oxidoreductase (nitroreductase family)
MEPQVQEAMSRGGIADITTTGRKTGKPHRVEIGFHALGGDYFITGHPGRMRDWLANLSVNPDFTLHLKRGVTADVPVTADVITDADEREAVLRRILSESWDNPPSKVDHIIGRWVEGAPLIRFEPAAE